MSKLRGPGGCPWDQEQTHRSLRSVLIEEVSELLDTIDREDMIHMREELGDVLLQVVFHAQMAEEKGLFSLDDVAAEINEKLVRRHPHVFGDAEVQDTAGVLDQWEAIKAKEKKNGPEQKGLFKNLPPALPALQYAFDIYKQFGKRSLTSDDLPDREGLKSLSEDFTEEAAGELLFQVAAACQLSDIDPESALREYTRKLELSAKPIEKESESANV